MASFFAMTLVERSRFGLNALLGRASELGIFITTSPYEGDH